MSGNIIPRYETEYLLSPEAVLDLVKAHVPDWGTRQWREFGLMCLEDNVTSIGLSEIKDIIDEENER